MTQLSLYGVLDRRIRFMYEVSYGLFVSHEVLFLRYIGINIVACQVFGTYPNRFSIFFVVAHAFRFNLTEYNRYLASWVNPSLN